MYNEFDMQCFPEPRGTVDYRSAFAIDRDRVIHSRAFRRLQAKTQVFSSGEYDFYRTRLTHSVEVGQIGRSICSFLAWKDTSKPQLDKDLVEAACLSHDLGNPPFGHSGERTLHRCMTQFGGFEGNAQTMRLITRRIFTEDSGRTGMKPTRALMDSVCKYKTIWDGEADNHFLYTDQNDCLEFIHERANVTEQSVECQVMDWADDIANGYADVNDGFKARLIDTRSLELWATNNSLDSEQQDDLNVLIAEVHKGDTEKFRARGIGDCIKAVSLELRGNPLSARTERHAYEVRIEPRIRKRCNLMKKIARGIVIQSALVQQLEAKTDRMMEALFKLLLENYAGEKPKSLLPHEADSEIRGEQEIKDKARFICDHLSGMSDDFAVRTYRRLFDPTFGSIGDFI